MSQALARIPASLPSPAAPADPEALRLSPSVRSVPKQFLDPPAAWNPTVGLFLAGYGLAALTI
jgi:beta-carotene hydroxylase